MDDTCKINGKEAKIAYSKVIIALGFATEAELLERLKTLKTLKAKPAPEPLPEVKSRSNNKTQAR